MGPIRSPLADFHNTSEQGIEKMAAQAEPEAKPEGADAMATQTEPEATSEGLGAVATQTETDGWPDGARYQLNKENLARRNDRLLPAFEAYGGSGPSPTRTAKDKANVLYHVIVVIPADKIALLYAAFAALPLSKICGTPFLTIEASCKDSHIVGVLDVLRVHGTVDPDDLLALMKMVAGNIKAKVSP